jgi:hypothetical protein
MLIKLLSMQEILLKIKLKLKLFKENLIMEKLQDFLKDNMMLHVLINILNLIKILIQVLNKMEAFLNINSIQLLLINIWFI